MLGKLHNHEFDLLLCLCGNLLPFPDGEAFEPDQSHRQAREQLQQPVALKLEILLCEGLLPLRLLPFWLIYPPLTISVYFLRQGIFGPEPGHEDVEYLEDVCPAICTLLLFDAVEPEEQRGLADVLFGILHLLLFEVFFE